MSDIRLADPKFGIPGRIDILLGVDVFVAALRQGRQYGPPGSPVALETDFGWVLAGSSGCDNNVREPVVTTHHVSITPTIGDSILQRFWEIEETVSNNNPLTLEEKHVVQHYKENHYRLDSGVFVTPLPRKQQHKPLGESRSKAIRRFIHLEQSLLAKGKSQEFHSVMEEYFDLDHAEVVPFSDLDKPPHQSFYLPMHAVRKDCSTTTKLRIVFDASAKTSTGVSLNDILLVGHTVHSSLVDVLLRFRLHRIALIADVSKMYRAVRLAEDDKDLHRFVWRKSPEDTLIDYRMTRVTFGVSASSFAANMSIKQNALDHGSKYPLAAKAVNESFYVDDGLTGADSVDEAIELQKQLQELFLKGGFLLRKWSSSNPIVLEQLPPELKDTPSSHSIPDPCEYTKTLGIQWNSVTDHFRLTVAKLPPLENITKRILVSDVAKTFDVLGWFSPTIIKIKILLQQLWEQKVDWDDVVPPAIQEVWFRWRSELDLLSTKSIHRCYFPNDYHVLSMELHGFCDASESAYAAVIYARMTDARGNIHVSLIMSKTKVAPIKRLTIPRLELCGAHMLANLLNHVKNLFHISLDKVYAWTDSTIVLNWLVGNPRRFKTYVGNRVSDIVDYIPPDRWQHVDGVENPADCGSRGLLPSELLEHELWWSGPEWLYNDPSYWPQSTNKLPIVNTDEERNVCFTTTTHHITPIISFSQFSSFTKMKRISAWILRFINNCRSRIPNNNRQTVSSSSLTTEEVASAEIYWLSLSQMEHFQYKIQYLKASKEINRSSCLLSLNPLLDKSDLLRVGGRQNLIKKPFNAIHPVIIHGKHPLTRLIVRSEHLRLMHAGVTLVHASLSQRFHIVGGRKVIRCVIRQCVICRKHSTKLETQLMGDLPPERITPDRPFANVGVDYAGPFYIKYGYVRKPTIVKTYACVFVSLSTKAVHLELVSDLTSDAFIACLRRFTARRGKPLLIMSDNGTNFVGANRELREFYEFLQLQKTQQSVSEFCSIQNIHWKFIPERTPHFGGLWEAAVKSMKKHLRCVVSDHKLTFEELSTVLAQVEACLNSRPITPIPDSDECLEALTPGHFLIGQPLEAIPDPSNSFHHSMTVLKRWQLVQSLDRHFWKRWSTEYLTTLARINKWRHPTRNIQVDDVVILKEDNLVSTKWPLARVIQIHPGKDNRTRVVTLKTSTGIYKRPINKLVLLLPMDNDS